MMLYRACTAPRAAAGRRDVGAPADRPALARRTACCSSPGCRCGRHGPSRLQQLRPGAAAAWRAVRAAADPRDAAGTSAGYGHPDVPEEWQDEWMSGARHTSGGGGGGGGGGSAAAASAGGSVIRRATGDQVPEAWVDEWQSGNPAVEDLDPTTPGGGIGGSSTSSGSSGRSARAGGGSSGSVPADTEQEIPDANVAGLSATDFGGSGSGSTPTAAQGTAAAASGVDQGRVGASLAGGLGARDAEAMEASRQAASGTPQPGGGGGEREDEDEPYSSHRRRGNWMT
ncbi:hypothetical protein HXX76_005819 [Chlamydomonas incerta]|uniref:Uncharacterized protein n=1 Tax=Chlamydomonas incerta TaxID=51695 RepID=A0A835T1C6_CHLIN|nr:hypothetical protein HXX76_005819 [Chlamydomonas incerta]|eukprot:KAG2437152.1 hypothetical protein HXX76_005819 [Chlamydomonas incerta]